MRNIHEVLRKIRGVINCSDERLRPLRNLRSLSNVNITARLYDVEKNVRYMAPELVWDYVYIDFIQEFIPPHSKLDYEILSIWTTKSVKELKELETN